MDTELDRAIKLRSDGKSEVALPIILSLLEADPSNGSLNLQVAWTYDSLGKESEAVSYYERAVEGQLSPEDRRDSLLGLGSTLRCLERFDDSERILRMGIEEFPPGREFSTFLALTLYNKGESKESLQLLLDNLLTTSSDDSITQYERALRFYCEQPDPPYDEG